MPQRDDIVKEAAKSVGYLSDKGYDQANRFSAYLGHPAESWCADFVTAIYGMTGLPLPSMQPGQPHGYAYVPDGWSYAQQHGAARSSWQAQPGDIVCFDWTNSGRCTGAQTHTGLVDHWAGGTLFTIEGNSAPDGGVNRHEWPAPEGTGNVQICGVIDTARLVHFGASQPSAPAKEVPPFPGRTLMLKSPPMQGDDVREWQQQMKQRGWHLEPSGVYDAPSRDLCVAFQGQKDLQVNGRVDAQTWAATWTAPVTPQ